MPPFAQRMVVTDDVFPISGFPRYVLWLAECSVHIIRIKPSKPSYLSINHWTNTSVAWFQGFPLVKNWVNSPPFNQKLPGYWLPWSRLRCAPTCTKSRCSQDWRAGGNLGLLPDGIRAGEAMASWDKKMWGPVMWILVKKTSYTILWGYYNRINHSYYNPV